MSPFERANIEILKTILVKEFIPNLPPPLRPNDTYENDPIKHLSRALSAFALHKICDISAKDAAQAVVDDFDDYGIDAIFYHPRTQTLYFVQSKLKGTGGITQGESLKFCNGIRKIISQNFVGFNQNISNRETDIKGALRDCEKIEIVIVHMGSEIDRHASEDFNNFISDRTHGELRLADKVINFNKDKVFKALQDAQAQKQVSAILFVEECSYINNPRTTYFGLIKLTDLIDLHNRNSEELYQRNIRTFLGHKTDVNVSIQQTLSENPQDFVYLNNGVTALCQDIRPRDVLGTGKNLSIIGISIINGAQTIGSSAKFMADNQDINISEARVSITLIKADAVSEFGDLVTRARNHQNQVLLSDFVALDEEQERLRRDIANLKLDYVYKANGADRQNNASQIYVDEAAQALSILQNDNRFAVLLKKKPIQLLNRDSDEYKELFKSSLTAYQLVNAVRFNRYIQEKIANAASNNAEESIFRNGNYIIAWILIKRIIEAVKSPALIDVTKLNVVLSIPFDELREIFLKETQNVLLETSPPNFFKNQARVNSLLRTVLSKYFNLDIGANEELRREEERNPDGFIEHLATLAPQINLND